MLESRYIDTVAATTLLNNNWLKNRSVYRGQKDHYVKELAAKMSQGRWVKDAMEVPMLVDTNGVLYNGQNRCRAIILANLGVFAQVRVESPERCRELYPTLDLGKGRDIADITGLHKGSVVQPILFLMRCSGPAMESRIKDEAVVTRIADTCIGNTLKHFAQKCSWHKHNRCFNSVQFKAAMAYCVHKRLIPDYDVISTLEMLQTQREHLWTPMFRLYREQIMFPSHKLNNHPRSVVNDKFCRAVYTIQKRMKTQKRLQLSTAYITNMAVDVRNAVTEMAHA